MNRKETERVEQARKILPDEHILDQFSLSIPAIPRDHIRIPEGALFHNLLGLKNPDPRIFPPELYLPKRYFSYWIKTVRDLLEGTKGFTKGDHFAYPQTLVGLLTGCMNEGPDLRLVEDVFSLKEPYSTRLNFIRKSTPGVNPAPLVQSICHQLSSYEDWLPYMIGASMYGMRHDGYHKNPAPWYILYSEWANAKHENRREFQKKFIRDTWGIALTRITVRDTNRD